MAKRRTIPARVKPDYQLIPVDDLSGGMDLRRSPSLIAPNRARLLRNFSLEEPGALPVAYGHSVFSSVSLGSARPQGAQRIYLTTGTFTLVAYGGDVYQPTDAGLWGSAVYSSISSGNQVYFPYDKDIVAVFDGANRPRKSAGSTTWTLMGIDPPASSSPPGIATSVGGSLVSSNEYEVAYTYYEAGLAVESDGSTTSTVTITGTSQTVTVTVYGSTDTQVDSIYIYARDKSAGESVKRYVGAVTNPGSGNSTTYAITSNSWDVGTEIPTTHRVPSAWSFGVVWKNRWWVKHPTVPNRLHFSELFQNQSYPATFYIDIPFERGDEITALATQGDTLLVFGFSKPFLIIGTTSLDFEVRPSLGAESGALGPRGVAAIESGVIHLSAEGVYIFDGAQDRLLSYDIGPGWDDLVGGASQANLAQMAVVYDPKRKEIAIAVPRLYPTGTWGEWILDLNRTRLTGTPAWTQTDRAIGGYILWDGNEAATGNVNRLQSWSPTTGQLFTERTGTAANSSNLTAIYDGPVFPTGLYMARFIDGRVEFLSASGTLTGETFIDGKTMGSYTIDIGASLVPYGSTVVYGTVGRLYGGQDRSYAPWMNRLGAEGRTVRQVWQYMGQDNFKLYTYAHGMIPEPETRGM